MAEMIAAQFFNQQKETSVKTIYGTITTGSLWKFLKLEDKIITVDLNEYFLNNVSKILAILRSGIDLNN